MKETLELDGKIGREIVDEIVDNSRWSINHTIVVQRKSDNKFFKSNYSVGGTERQSDEAYDYVKAIFEEVVPVQKTITVYE
jgi:hypothetical protein